jgi:hypothetical protein
MSIIAVANRLSASQRPSLICGLGYKCLRNAAFLACALPGLRRNSCNPSSASPSLPLTNNKSSGRAPDRVTARPFTTSPTTVTLMRIRSCRVVSPPAMEQPKNLDALRSPPRNSSSHLPVCVVGIARFNKKHRGVPPIAAMSLAARARHFHPTLSAGCVSLRKWDPSRNQSLVRIVSKPGRGFQSAASSPTPKRMPLSPAGGTPREILRTRPASGSDFGIKKFNPNPACPFGQWIVSQALYQKKINTGLTSGAYKN